MIGWHYRAKAPAEKVRDPIQGEFFSTEAIKDPADALVRESIQNALDATLKDKDGLPKDVLKIRFFLADGKYAMPAHKAAKWFAGTWGHFQAPGNGLRQFPQRDDKCPWLVFEDFNTTGLEGDVQQADPIDGMRNSFFYFFRAEGRSGKTGEERGRWGVGKHVFPRSSRANAFFGLSVRHDDGKRVMMGHSVFKSHRVGRKFYCPDGYYGKLDASGLVLPITDAKTLDNFSNEFQVKRKTESGLSVVIPWIDEEITAEALIKATVRGYFYPILTGALAVTVETPEERKIIDESTLEGLVLDLDKSEGDKLAPLVELAQWSSTRKPQEILRLAPCSPDDRPQWTENLMPQDQLKSLQRALDDGDKLAIRASLTVRQKGKAPRLSHFDFFLWKDGFESGRPVFIREGLIISDVRAPRSRGVRSLVVTESGALGTLLGDAENPAHTEWQSKGENFRGKYVWGPACLDFVTNAVANFIHALASEDEERDPILLLDIFSLPPEEDDGKGSTKEKEEKKKRETAPIDDPGPQEPKQKRFKIQRSAGGFKVMRGDAEVSPPARLSIQVAYDIRRGNPLAKYNTADFCLNKSPIKLDPAPCGLRVLRRAENRLLVEVIDADFSITVSGFDEKRDLFVNVKMQEGPYDTEI